MAKQTSKKKRKFVADAKFYAELNEVLTREFAEYGYSGAAVRVTPVRTEIIIRAKRALNVLGEKGRRIWELASLVQKRFMKFDLLVVLLLILYVACVWKILMKDANDC
ncbi:unnamed protein product [Microthlaspi erraticum]|uniref:KH type-2 domain-containing protein n=1 Tax=Microthlaspi erraticum TaxID=1685480 RepID=A0A6D2L6L6_9BRAS|nr:unnamed protein product [Microthlaspi erraticum]